MWAEVLTKSYSGREIESGWRIRGSSGDGVRQGKTRLDSLERRVEWEAQTEEED